MKITLKTYDGIHYVCATKKGSDLELVADRTEDREWETFDVFGSFVFGGYISLRAWDGTHYVCAQNGGGSDIKVDRLEAREWETFRIIGTNDKADGSPVRSGDKIYLQTFDGIHYLNAQNGGGKDMKADPKWAKEWETFTINIVDSSTLNEPTLVEAELITDTGNDNKDKDTGVNVKVLTANQQILIASCVDVDKSNADATEYNDGSQHTIKLDIHNNTLTKSQCQNFHVEITQHTDDSGWFNRGNDKWKFNARVFLSFSDGTQLIASKDNIKLKGNNASDTFDAVPKYEVTILSQQPRKILHISDLHFATSFGGLVDDWGITLSGLDIPVIQHSKTKSEAIASYLINNAVSLGAKHIVITGDFTASGDEGDYNIPLDFIKRLKAVGFTLSIVPGNHDYCKEGNQAISLFDEHARRDRFIDNITPEYRANPKYPQIVNIIDSTGQVRKTRLILLDSMQGELDANTDNNLAQGSLGLYQLDELKRLLQNRKADEKILIALHHSPFSDDSKGWLSDRTKFLEIISHKVGGLLFGHTGDPCHNFSKEDSKKKYGISLINSENLEDIKSRFPISIIDLDSNQIDVQYATWAGGIGGGRFSDNAIGRLFQEEWRIFKIEIRTGLYVDSIQLFYENTKTGEKIASNRHGGQGGSWTQFELSKGEYITKVSGHYDSYINSITIQTNKGTYGTFGMKEGETYEFSVDKNKEIIGFYGKSGSYVDGIGVIVRNRKNK